MKASTAPDIQHHKHAHQTPSRAPSVASTVPTSRTRRSHPVSGQAIECAQIAMVPRLFFTSINDTHQ